jgi:hypothetical protein
MTAAHNLCLDQDRAPGITMSRTPPPSRALNNVCAGNRGQIGVGMDSKGFNFSDHNVLIGKLSLGDRVDLGTWREKLGWDEHSTDRGLTGWSLDKESLTLTLTVDDAFLEMKCPPVPGVERDFSGNPIGAGSLPGPFQNLKKGKNTIRLWPIPGLLPFDGRRFSKLWRLAMRLEGGAAPASILREAGSKLGSADPVTAEEAKLIVDWITEQGRRRLASAVAAKDSAPLECLEMLDALSREYSGTDLGREARDKRQELNGDAAFRESLRPWRYLKRISEVERRMLSRKAGGPPGSDGFKRANRLVIVQIVRMAEQMKRRYPDSPATAQALAVAARYE